MNVRKFVFLSAAALAVATTSLRTTDAGTIAVQFAETNTSEVTIIWNGSYDTTGYTTPVASSGSDVYGSGTGTTGNQSVLLSLYSSGSEVSNLNQYSVESVGSFSLTGSAVRFTISASNTNVDSFSGNVFSITYLTDSSTTAFLVFEDTGSGGVHTVSGSATISGAGATLSSIFPIVGERIALATGAVTNFSDGNGNIVTFQIVPEPSTYAMLLAGVGCGAAAFARRCRGSRNQPRRHDA